MNLENEPPARRSSGPWMIKTTGHWGSGLHSKNDFEIYILDLSSTPDHDPCLPPGSPTTFVDSIEEDLPPLPDLTVDLGDQAIIHTANGSELRDVDDVL